MENQIENFPKEVIEKMLYEQEAQGNKRDLEVFKIIKLRSKSTGGFNWNETIDKEPFWRKVIEYKDFDLFFKKYPKMEEKPYPKVMLVSDSIDFRLPEKRVVFMKKNNVFLAWNYAITIEESEFKTGTTAWKYAKDIEETIEITMQEIADKFNLKVENIKIT